MYLSRIRIENFRNFSALDVQLVGNVVIVGENRVGKTNLLYALRLIFDPSLADSARQLALTDFWDGLDPPGEEHRIVVSVEICEFEDDQDVLAILTDYRLDDDPDIVRLTYEFRPRAGLDAPPKNSDDYEFVCFGGESETKRFGHDLRRRITMDLLPALRDAEGDLATWRRSPLRPLIEDAFSGIDRDELKAIATEIEAATAAITKFPEVGALETSIANLFAEMSGPKQDVELRLGFSPTDAVRLYRNLKLLIDGGIRGINDASLGSANLVFLSLKALEIRKLIDENRRDHTLLAIEEPEAHLHPHLQRSVYRHLFESIEADDGSSPLSVILTSHSPHIASVAPVRSILLLRDSPGEGTLGRSTATLELTQNDFDDLERYLDVTRAEMMFARGVILVEGDAERFLIPAFAKEMAVPLDHLGITVCSVSGTNFQPYAKFLGTLGIPFAIVTDWDPRDDGKRPYGYSRALDLVKTIETIRTGEAPEELIAELTAIPDYNDFSARCEELGVFTNRDTLETDLFNNDYSGPIISALRDVGFGPKRTALLNAWEKDPTSVDPKALIAMIESMGKGRFAQRLGSCPTEWCRSCG